MSRCYRTMLNGCCHHQSFEHVVTAAVSCAFKHVQVAGAGVARPWLSGTGSMQHRPLHGYSPSNDQTIAIVSAFMRCRAALELGRTDLGFESEAK